MTGRLRVVVVGGGVIGLAVAWRCAAAGDEVCLIDPEPGRGASWVAGGMLAPVAEVAPSEQPLLRLGLASRARWPAFAEQLARASDRELAYTTNGTLVVARDDDDVSMLGRLARLQRSFGLDPVELEPRAARRREPALAPGLRGALWLTGDHQVDNRLLVQALLTACERFGVVIDRRRVGAVHDGSVTLEDATEREVDVVVLATGATPVRVESAGQVLEVPIRPVKGQILRVQDNGRAVLPAHTVRGLDVYVIPRPHGEIAIGATTEDVGADTTVTTGAIHDLLRDACEIVPGLAETRFLEARAGLRPATPDHTPIIGRPRGTERLVLATGHYRSGVLLAPLTADLVLDVVHDRTPADRDGDDRLLADCSPDRFARHGRPLTGIAP